jgi:putative DNA primase/helicase
MRMEINAFLAHFKGVSPSGSGWSALCPAHNDDKASLSVGSGERGILIKCHAGCTAEGIVAAVGLTLRDLFPDDGNGASAHIAFGRREHVPTEAVSRVAAEYIYRIETGDPYLRVVRLEPKSFRQMHWNGSGWVSGKPSGPKIPYRLSELIAAPFDAPVFICEGEKDAGRLAGCGLVATTASEGAGKWTADLNQWFGGRIVFILADNDPAGQKHAQHVAQNLTGIAAQVRIVDLPGLPEKGDASDWLDAGNLASGLVDLCRTFPIYEPPKTDAGDGDKHVAEDDLETVLRQLAERSPFKYDLVRVAVAKRLKVRVSSLDAEVEKRRRASSTDGDFAEFLTDPEPWPESAEGADLLDRLTATIAAHMILPDGAAETIALWVIHAHAHDCVDVSPILGITSPTPECGKSTLLTLLAGLVPRALTTANISAAALFRAIDKWRPTVLIDEADSFVGENDELRNVVNSGHQRANAYVIRAVGDDFDPKRFRTWAPKVVAQIGNLFATWASRAIHIELKRKAAFEKVKPLRLDRLGHLEPLKRQTARFVLDNQIALRAADPELPAELDGRPADNWRPLIAIADVAGGDWPARVRQIAQRSAKRDEATAGIMLLEDIRNIFGEREKSKREDNDKISSADLVKALGELEERPWPEWRADKPITQRQLAKLLEPFRIAPGTIRLADGKTPKGYKLSSFEDAFARYLPARSATPPQGAENLDSGGFSSATKVADVADQNGQKPAENRDCGGVADRKAGSGAGVPDGFEEIDL